MDGTINEVFIKLSSRIPFKREIQRGEDLRVIVDGQEYIFNCVKREELDKQDGTYDLVCVLKSLSE